MDKVTEKGHSCQHQHHRNKNKLKVEHHVEYDNLLTPRCIIEEGSIVFFRFFFLNNCANISSKKVCTHIYAKIIVYFYTANVCNIFWEVFFGRNRHLFFHRKKITQLFAPKFALFC